MTPECISWCKGQVEAGISASQDYSTFGMIAFICILLIYFLDNWDKGDPETRERWQRTLLLFSLVLLGCHTVYKFFIL